MCRVEVLCHSSIRIQGKNIIYIDPYKIKKEIKDADYIFITHSHYDHFSEKDIRKIIKEDTVMIVPFDLEEKALKLLERKEKLITVLPNMHYKIDEIEFDTTYAYNINKLYHPKDNNWVGYLLKIEDESYYIAGDTDNIKELQKIQCDIALLPIGGTYTMDYNEAADLANSIKAKVIIPTHYGLLVGKKEDAKKFASLVKKKEVKILIK